MHYCDYRIEISLQLNSEFEKLATFKGHDVSRKNVMGDLYYQCNVTQTLWNKFVEDKRYT